MTPSLESRPRAVPERQRVRWLAPLLVTAAMTVSLGWLARTPWQPPGSEDALLRLSWRLRPPVSETCRARTQAELDALPVHMRTLQVCVNETGAYRLIVQLDTSVSDTTRVRRGGAKGDRPLYVFCEVPIPPGRHHVRIRFEPEKSMSADRSFPPLSLDTVLHMQAGVVALVTLDPDGRTITVRRSIQP